MVFPRIHLNLIPFVVAIVVAPIHVTAQTAWRQLKPATSPLVDFKGAAAYDSARQRVVLVADFLSQSPNATWEWDGKNWINRLPTKQPPARLYHAVAYDEARRRTVLFGGRLSVSPSPVNDTWEWDGTNWTLRNPVTKPPGHMFHAMTYDSARQRVILFGGSHNGPGPQNDTWEWDGYNWTMLNPATSPPVRGCHALVYDSARQRTVLFGGYVGWKYWSTLFNDTWEWDGKNWTLRQPTTIPPGRYFHAMVYDSARQRVVLHGGYCTYSQWGYGLGDDHWEWDGNVWQRASHPTPSRRDKHAMVYDSFRQQTVLFGGSLFGGFASGKNLTDTWIHSPVDLTASSPSVSATRGGSIKLFLDAGTAHAGKYYWVVGCMDGGNQRGISLGPKVKLLLHPDWYFRFAVNHPNLLIAGSFNRLDSQGKATATIGMPVLPTAMIGLRFFHAYAVLGPSGFDYASTPVLLTVAK